MANITEEITQAVRRNRDCTDIAALRILTGRSARTITEKVEASPDLYLDDETGTVTYVGDD
jgi:hypothetical protein